jgi:hypothetical protein
MHFCFAFFFMRLSKKGASNKQRLGGHYASIIQMSEKKSRGFFNWADIHKTSHQQARILTSGSFGGIPFVLAAKSHPWFRSISWERLMQRKYPLRLQANKHHEKLFGYDGPC